MKSTGMSRPVDALGRIVIPKEIRTAFGIGEGDRLVICVEDGAILFRKKEPNAFGTFDTVRELINKCSGLSKDDVERFDKMLDEIEFAIAK